MCFVIKWFWIFIKYRLVKDEEIIGLNNNNNVGNVIKLVSWIRIDNIV